MLGALRGAIACGTYKITKHAVLKGRTIWLVISDIAWGTFLTAVVAASGSAAREEVAVRSSNLLHNATRL